MNVMFHFDEWSRDVWSGRSIDLDCWFKLRTLWGVKKLACVNRTEMDIRTGREDFEVFDTVDDFMEAHRHDQMIQMQHPSKTVTTIDAIKSPQTDTWFMFGPAEGWDNIAGLWPVAVNQRTLDSHHAPFIAAIVAHKYRNS